MLNLRRQNQRFETLIQNAVYGGAVYAHFFRVCYVDPRRQVKLGRALSLKFCIQAAREHEL